MESEVPESQTVEGRLLRVQRVQLGILRGPVVLGATLMLTFLMDLLPWSVDTQVATKIVSALLALGLPVAAWPTTEHEPDLLLIAAEQYEAIGATAQALVLHQRIVDTYPDDVRAKPLYLKVGEDWEARGEPERAIYYLQHLAVKYEPQDLEAALALAAEQWEEISPWHVQTFYVRALERFPQADPEWVVEVRARIEVLEGRREP